MLRRYRILRSVAPNRPRKAHWPITSAKHSIEAVRWSRVATGIPIGRSEARKTAARPAVAIAQVSIAWIEVMAQCAEGEDQEQHAEEGDADGRYRQQEHELQRHVRGDLEHGEIVVGESVTDAGFRQHGEGADNQQAAEPEQRGNVDRDDAVKGVEQQDEGAERVA